MVGLPHRFATRLLTYNTQLLHSTTTSLKITMGQILSRLVVLPLSNIYILAAQFSSFLTRAFVGQLGNEYLAGMVVWGMMGSLGDALKKIYDQVHAWVLSQIFTNVRLGEQETKELMEYLKQHPLVPNSSMLNMKTHSNVESEVSGSRIYEYEPELNTAIRFYHESPTTGLGCWIWVANYSYAESSTQPDPVVSTTVTVLGRDKSPVEEMIDLGREMLRNKRRKFLQVITTYNYTQDNYGLGWNHGYKTDKKQPGRSIKSVILPRLKQQYRIKKNTSTDRGSRSCSSGGGTGVGPGGGGTGGGGSGTVGGRVSDGGGNDNSSDDSGEGGIDLGRNGRSGGSGNSNPREKEVATLDQAEALLADAREFLESERWYTERGIPYRRGYLLWGIPGGGKSSLVAAVASELKLPIYMLQLSNELLTDDGLHRLFQTMTENPSILLLEDIDAASDLVKKREDGEEERVEGEEGEGEDEGKEEEEEEEEEKETVEVGDSDVLTTPVKPANDESEVKQDVGNEGKDEKVKLLDNGPEQIQTDTERDHSENADEKDEEDEADKKSSSSPSSSSQDTTNMMMLQLMKQQQAEQKKNREEQKKRDRKLTLSGLLNALDGPTATTGRLLFMTTNFRNKLDPALIRSGRIDYDIEFKYVDAEQAERIFQRFYLSFRDVEKTSSTVVVDVVASSATTRRPETSELEEENVVVNDSDKDDSTSAMLTLRRQSPFKLSTEKEEVRKLSVVFANAIKLSGLSLSAADLQGHLMKYKSDPRCAIDMMHSELLNKPSSKSKKNNRTSSAKRSNDGWKQYGSGGTKRHAVRTPKRK